MVHRRGLTLVAAAFALADAAACKKPPPADLNATDAGPPSDHLAKDEIAEGNEKAFTLVLPRNVFPVYRIQGAVAVESDLSFEKLSNYVRSHVTTSKVTAGASQTRFDDAIVPSSPATHLDIEVRLPGPNSSHRSALLVRDVTPMPPVPKTSDEDAYRAIGRKLDGTPLDPKHMD